MHTVHAVQAVCLERTSTCRHSPLSVRERTQFILAVLSGEHCWTVTGLIEAAPSIEARAIATDFTL